MYCALVPETFMPEILCQVCYIFTLDIPIFPLVMNWIKVTVRLREIMWKKKQLHVHIHVFLFVSLCPYATDLTYTA